MDLIQGLVLITFVHSLAAVSPGPDFVLVCQQTLSHGRRAGYLCSIGIALGLSIPIIYSAFGLAAIIASSTTAFWLIKILGGSYLIYLGIKAVRARPANDIVNSSRTEVSPSIRKSLNMGLLCNILNPKAPIYFVALFTLVLSPDMPSYRLAIYAAGMMLIQLAWFSIVKALLSTPAVSRKIIRAGLWINRLLGGAMIVMGLKLMTTRAN